MRERGEESLRGSEQASERERCITDLNGVNTRGLIRCTDACNGLGGKGVPEISCSSTDVCVWRGSGGGGRQGGREGEGEGVCVGGWRGWTGGRGG